MLYTYFYFSGINWLVSFHVFSSGSRTHNASQEPAAFDKPHDVDLTGGDARSAVVDIDDEEEPVFLEDGAHVADAGGTVRLHGAHAAERDERAGPGECAADADAALGRDYGGAGEVEDLELGLCDEQEVFDEDAVLGREQREHGLGDLVFQVLLEHGAQGAGFAHGVRECLNTNSRFSLQLTRLLAVVLTMR